MNEVVPLDEKLMSFLYGLGCKSLLFVYVKLEMHG